MAFSSKLRMGAMRAALPVGLLAVVSATAFAQSGNDATLRILSPRTGDALGAAPFKIDVSFAASKRAAVAAIELWCDGVRWVRRDLTTPQTKNVLTFDVDATALSAGVHKFVVKIYTTTGGVVSAPISIQAGNDSGIGELNGDLRLAFTAPTNGKKVSGNVELMLDVKTATGANPYVTFYVDNQFKTLKNYPPYAYVWDTTTASNGYHLVEATAYTESANNTVSKKIKLFVDNVGGNTVRQNVLPDLSRPGALAGNGGDVVSPMAAATLTMPLTKRVIAPRPVAPIVRRAPAQFSTATPSARTGAGSMGLRGLENGTVVITNADLNVSTPGDTGIRSVITRTATQRAVRNSLPALPSRTNAVTRPATMAAPSVLLTQPAAPVKPVVITTPRVAVSVAAPVRRVAPVAIASVSQARVVKPVVVTRPAVAPRSCAVRIEPSRNMNTILPAQTNVDVKPLQIAFDGERIAFDVQPRIEAGMPIAPFRQIFEHTGGRLDWANDTKMVRAVNADREVIIGIGKNSARVNGANITMDKPAFIESGRTIVPLSFVGKALDVDVNYDAATGRLQITSKK